MTLTRYGIREWGSALAASIILWAGCFVLYKYGFIKAAIVIAAVVLVLFLAIAAFFRNPHRKLPSDETLLPSPADGTIRDIEVVHDFDLPPFKGDALRIGIFLSVLNVHVNRTPSDLTVTNVNYRPGKYLDARDPKCGKENEAMTISGNAKIGEKTFPMAIRQISGAIARRIVCPVHPGRELKRGKIYGMIKFGSRTELYLPATGFEVKVKVGDKVKGGQSVVAAMTAEGSAAATVKANTDGEAK
jgi:phosphatidylserine decarboxylase